MCFCVLCLNAQVLYSTEFATEEDFKAWTVLDVNEDGCTWTFDDAGTYSKVYYLNSAAL